MQVQVFNVALFQGRRIFKKIPINMGMYRGERNREAAMTVCELEFPFVFRVLAYDTASRTFVT